MFFQYATEKEFRAPAERITGRTVRAFVSGIDAGQIVGAVLPHTPRPVRGALPVTRVARPQSLSRGHWVVHARHAAVEHLKTEPTAGLEPATLHYE